MLLGRPVGSGGIDDGSAGRPDGKDGRFVGKLEGKPVGTSHTRPPSGPGRERADGWAVGAPGALRCVVVGVTVAVSGTGAVGALGVAGATDGVGGAMSDAAGWAPAGFWLLQPASAAAARTTHGAGLLIQAERNA